MRWRCAFLLALLIPQAVLARTDEPQLLDVNFPSAVLSSFWGQPVAIYAEVLLPDSYYKEPSRRYPVLYWIPAFDSIHGISLDEELAWQRPMRALHMEVILVFLDVMFDGGAQEFADSANYGPWGTALTTEFIPETDAYFRTIPDAQHRFVAGHSSGGWAALWVQVTYPQLFGGEWSVSPDPVDFQNFCGPDLTATPARNFYTSPGGAPYTVNWGGRMTLKSLATSAWSFGPAQFDSFDSVFGPRGKDGRPEQLFDRRTGTIDAAVAEYWETHYDIARILHDKWRTLEPELAGKLHIVVGTNDNFHLNDSVVLLASELKKLGSDAEIDFAPGADHWTVFDWNGGLDRYILREIQQRAGS